MDGSSNGGPRVPTVPFSARWWSVAQSSAKPSSRHLRFEHGETTQRELVVHIGAARQTVNAIEVGKYSPSLAVGFRIVRAFGATLWADFALNGIPETMRAKAVAHRRMADFTGLIRHRAACSRRRSPNVATLWIAPSSSANWKSRPRWAKRPWWSPSMRRRRARFALGAKATAFAPDLEGVIARHGPRLCIHGHMHDSVDEQPGPTRANANPGDCTPTENPRFDPSLCVDIGP